MEPRKICVVRSYDELIQAIRARADELKLAGEQIDHIAGLPTRYTAKLLMKATSRASGARTFGRYSLGPILCTMGLVLIVAEDSEMLASLQHRFVERNEKQAHAGHKRAGHRKRHRFPQGNEFAKLMRARQLLNQTPEQRSMIARVAAQARWANKPGRVVNSQEVAAAQAKTLSALTSKIS